MEMRNIKSERLKKLEVELQDLEQWLKLGLVPKKDIEKHKDEIIQIKSKIDEEKERLQFLKESGDVDEFVAPKRPAAGSRYTEMPTIPDIDMPDTAGSIGDSHFDMDSEGGSSDSSVIEERDDDDDESDSDEDEEEESYFSDKNRWKRGGIVDPDADDW